MKYKYLDEFLDNHFIPNNVIYRQTNDTDILDNVEYEKVINLYRISGLKLTDEEKNYVIKYLNDRGIVVKGRTDRINFESDSYVDTKNYSGGTLKEFNKEETIEKLKQYKETKDPAIRNEIVEGNMRLVALALKKMPVDYEVDIYDLRQAGYLGLMQAVERFDPEKGAFSTFAVSYIIGYIKREMHHLRGINATDAAIYKLMKEIENENGDTIENNPAIAKKVVEKIIEQGLRSDIYEEENLRRIMMLNTVSLDEILEQNEDENIYNLGYVEKDEDFDCIYAEERANILREEIEKLSDKKRRMLELRFGLNDDEERTFAAIGKEFGMTSFGANLCVRSSCKELSENEKVRELK